MSKLLLNLVFCFAACSASAIAAEPDSLPGVSTSKPNVIFIKTDDQRYDSLSMTGHPVTKTPNIDQLATEGVFFNQAFITSPICGPSRANFFTGQWERRNRVGFPHVSRNFIAPSVFDNSWLMQLKRAGYFTGYIGKHHTNIGEVKQRNRYMKENLDFCYMKPGHLGFDLLTRKEFSNLKNSSQIEGLLEATEAFIRPGKDKDYFFANADASVKDFLSERDTSKPFCLSINFNLPHAASIGGMGGKATDPEMYRTLYNDQRRDFEFPQGYPNIDVPLPKEVFQQDELMQYYRTTNERVLLNKKIKMARAVTGIDLFVGNLRKQLTELDLDGNTILVFISDHGLLLGEHGLGGKTFLYEESIHVPLIVHSPFFGERERGKTIDKLVVGQDVPATILEMCGLDVPKSYQGKSLVPLMEDRQTNWRTDVFCENLFTDQGYPRMEAVRNKNWKYIRYFSKENDRKVYLPDSSINGEQPIFEELFRLNSDPKEQVNLVDHPEYQHVLEHFRVRCQKLVGDMSGREDLSNTTKEESPLVPSSFVPKGYYPKFSWDTTPMYFMFGDTRRVLTSEEVSSIAPRTDFLSIEKSHGSKELGSAELGAKHESAAFKKIKPDVKVLFYFNAAYAWPFTSYNQAFKRNKIDAHPELKKFLLVDPETGQLAHRNEVFQFDVLNPEFRQWWVDTVAKGVEDSDCDGVFIDQIHGFAWLRHEKGRKVQQAMGDMMGALKQKMGADKILIGNNAHETIAKHVFPVIDGSMFEHYDEKSLSKENLLQDWKDMSRIAKAGKMSIFRIGVEHDHSLSHEVEQPDVHSQEYSDKMAALAKERVEYYLACYLIGAQSYSYFQYGWGWTLSSGSLHDYPELHKPLGAPKGAYQRTTPQGWDFTREFEHASVWVDTESKKAKIKWKN